MTKLNLHAPGLVKPARSRSAHRKKRQRRPLPGMMLHQDGSRHVWIDRPPMDLIVTLDDATSATLRALREVIATQIATHGLFCALYTDRSAHYFHTPKGGEKASRTHRTQVGRALAQLGIEHIDTTTPMGKLVFQVTGAFAEFERSMIRQRIKAGLKCAVAQGTRLGRPKVDVALERRAQRQLEKGVGILKVAKMLGLGTGTVQRIKEEMRAT